MIKKLHSGKFWLKLLVLMSTVWVVLMCIGYALSIWGLSDERVHKALQQAMPSGRTIEIGAISAKGWLPYPSVTLDDVSITYPNQTQAQIQIKQLQVQLSWQSLLGQSQLQSVHLQQPQLHVARLSDGSWNIDDFYRHADANATSPNDINIVDGNLHVRESEHQYHLQNINVSVQNWHDTESQLHLAFKWDSDWIGAQKVHLQGQLEKTQQGFRSNDVKIQVDNHVPHIGEVSWLANGQFEHVWLEHRNDFRNIQIKGQNASKNFTAQLSIPEAKWQKVWQIKQTNGVLQWEQDQHTTTATIKLNPTEISSRHFKTQNSSLDLLLKRAHETFSIKASGNIGISNTGAFGFDNWHISTRQSDINLVNSSLFQSEGMLNMAGNIHDQWQMQWKGQIDNDAAQIDLKALSPEQWFLDIQAKQLDLDRYQAWSRPKTNLEAPVAPATQNSHSQWWEEAIVWRYMPDNWQLQGRLNVERLNAEQIQLNDLNASMTLNSQGIQFENIEAIAYDGQLQAALNMPRDAKEPSQLQMSLRHLQIQPWLQHWREYNRLSGLANVKLNLQSQGQTWSDIQQQLNGQLQIDIQNGAFQGVSLEHFLHHDGNPNMQLSLDDDAQTTFEAIQSTSDIKNGVLQTKILDVHLPMGLQLHGQGKYQLVNNKLDYQLKFGEKQGKHVLPIRITGALGQPNFSLDYQGLTKGLVSSTDKSNAVRNALRKQWQLWQLPELDQPASAP